MSYFKTFILLVIISGTVFAQDEESTEKNITIVSFFDLGHVIKGEYLPDAGEALEVDNLFLNRSGIGIITSGTIADRLDMTIGVGGLFFKPFPELNTNLRSKYIGFGPGIAEASFKMRFKENLSLKFGYFPYKYNENSSNLGEYLLRSEAYPTTINTSGWVWMNVANYKSAGFHLNWSLADGMFNQDFLLFSEYNATPIYDFSLSYVANLKTSIGFNIGGGATLHRILPVKPSATTPNDEQTVIREVTFSEFPNRAEVTYTDVAGVEKTEKVSWRAGTPFDANAFITADASRAGGLVKGYEMEQYGELAGNVKGSKDHLKNKIKGCSSIGYSGSSCFDSYINTDQDSIFGINPVTGEIDKAIQTPLVVVQEEKLTFQAIKLVGFASLDFNKMFDMPAEDIGPFSLFTEVAVLGVQNQLWLYEELSDRVPMMFGAKIPTGGFLDVLAIEMQYFPNKWPDNNFQQFTESLPIPELSRNVEYFEYQRNLLAGEFEKDDTKWSLYAKKTLFQGLTVFLQVANDHFRLQNVFTQPTAFPLTQDKSHFYYLLRFQWMM